MSSKGPCLQNNEKHPSEERWWASVQRIRNKVGVWKSMGWKYNDSAALAVAFNLIIWFLYPVPVCVYTAHENLKASQARGLSY